MQYKLYYDVITQKEPIMLLKIKSYLDEKITNILGFDSLDLGTMEDEIYEDLNYGR